MKCNYRSFSLTYVTEIDFKVLQNGQRREFSLILNHNSQIFIIPTLSAA